MQHHRSFVACTALSLLLSACASTTSTAPEAPRHVGLSLHEAAALVASFEAKQVPAQNKMPAPTTLDEARAILKSDRIDAFPSAVAYLAQVPGYEAQALRAQMLLAWGEAELTVAEILGDTADKLDENARGLAVKPSSPDVKTELDAAQARVQLFRDTDASLRLLAAEHVAVAVEDSAKLITQKPDDYVPYRIAADAHRMRNEWKEFAAMVAKVEERNPDSNGLVFLRGVAAQFRDNDASEAVKLYRQALEKDPLFVRAQAQLVLVSTNIFEQFTELEKLKAASPDHQIVRWAGPGIADAYQRAVARQQALQNAMGQNRQPVTAPKSAQ